MLRPRPRGSDRRRSPLVARGVPDRSGPSRSHAAAMAVWLGSQAINPCSSRSSIATANAACVI
eukprot:9295104-Alexandrium_andersonii.AAC.1